MKRLAASLLDVAIVVEALLVLFALLIGGTLSIGTVRIGLRSVDNPVTILAVTVALRYACGARSFDRVATRTLRRFDAWSRLISWPSIRWWIAGIALSTLVLKIWFAATSPGFFSGDDVEVHEMSLSVLLGRSWPIWDLRSPIFPLGVIFPAQWLVHAAGVGSVTGLVFAGRMTVAIASTLSVLLVALIGRRLWPEQPGYAVLAAALFGFAKLSIAFGSSELPRPVASVLLLAAFLAIQRTGTASVAVAGVLAGAAASFRFSEIGFLVAAAIQLMLARRALAVVLFSAAAVVTAALLFGLGDLAFWGRPFHSALAAFDYTVVRHLSSRGYQPVWWYVTALGQWTTLPVLILAVAGAARLRSVALWAFVPLVLLSVLPHKEGRYAIPSIPFVCLLAAEGVRRVAAGAATDAGRSWKAAAVVAGLGLGAVHDAGHFRLPRSNAEVAFARSLQALECPNGLAAQQLWRLGGHLYLPQRPLIDLDPGQMNNGAYLSTLPAGAAVVLDTRGGLTPETTGFLRDRGYVEQLVDAPSGYALWRVR